MSQQEMNYGEMNRSRPESSYTAYEGLPPYNLPGDKLSGHTAGRSTTAGQRLALGIASLVMLMLMTFGLIVIAAALHAPNWAIIPILFILVLFSAVAVIINIVFNRNP